ncbi:nucleotidyltransferase domain-containing protein [Labedaea rhizosphaerae]|uniref:Nucleotidyltransferase n=1 Tax=Labedaea rhizosphaerae TaxID=598644 RepID=A0A4R6SG22_LABRH|nr:nucleotidyltransferase [Labedaea rhizosphaerae]TDP98155.1 hypothetical protein EV186_1031135 [Labedaea rhizosphaerae]
MATLPSYFREALKNIEPGDDAANAKNAHAEVSKYLKADPWLKNLGVDPFLIGSYARDVSIRRVKDVDVFARLRKATSDLRPGQVLDKMEDVLTVAFEEDRVERQHRSIKVDFPTYELSVDAVPARPCNDHWEIPNRPEHAKRAQWVETNPIHLGELTTEANKDFLLNDKGIYVPTVKLVRQIRRTWVDDQPGGLYFEILTYWAFQQTNPSENTVAEYLTTILATIADQVLPEAVEHGLDDPTMPDKKITTKATDDQLLAALDRTREAADLAQRALDEDDDCRAALAWQQLFGKTTEGEVVFPMPSYCNADGTWKSTGIIPKGSPNVAAGTGRYA